MKSMMFTTADLCDEHGDDVQIVEPVFQDFGFRKSFSGPATTVVAPADNSLVVAAVEETGLGRVLIVDGGGERTCALLGDRLAFLAYEHNWAGVVVNGMVRDAGELETIDIGIKALGAYPKRSTKADRGERDVPVAFGGVTIRPGNWVYADEDGILIAEAKLV
jgi:regulator of ribonuclease activity A